MYHLVLLLAWLRAVCWAIPSPLSLLGNRNGAVIQWEFQAIPNGGHGLLLPLNGTRPMTGTADQVHEQLRRTIPQFDMASGFQKRDDMHESLQSFEHLINLGLRPRAVGGIDNCGEASCTNKQGLWLCNKENKHQGPLTKEEYKSLIADMRRGYVDMGRFNVCTSNFAPPGSSKMNNKLRKRNAFPCNVIVLQAPGCRHLMEKPHDGD